MWAQEPRSLHLIPCIIDLGRETALPACILHIWIFINQPLESATCSCTELKRRLPPSWKSAGILYAAVWVRGAALPITNGAKDLRWFTQNSRWEGSERPKGGRSPQTCLSSAIQWKRKQFTDTDTGTRTVLTPSQLCVNSIHTHSCKS